MRLRLKPMGLLGKVSLPDRPACGDFLRGQLRRERLYEHMHEPNALAMRMVQQTRRARETQRSEPFLARHKPTGVRLPVFHGVLEPPVQLDRVRVLGAEMQEVARHMGEIRRGEGVIVV